MIGGFFLSYNLYLNLDKNIVILVSDNIKANKLFDALSNLIDPKDIVLFLENDTIRIEYISSSKEILSNRIYALNEMINSKHKIFIITPSSFYRYYPTKKEFINSTLNLKINSKCSYQELNKKLIEIGYSKVSKIDQSLEFSSRGEIIDIYSINYDDPIRIEFFDDKIESIRFFDIGTQKSLEKIDEVTILPSTNLIFNSNEKDNIDSILSKNLDEDLTNLRDDLKDILKEEINNIKNDLINGIFNSKAYKYYGILKENKVNLLSYLSSFEEIILDENEFLKEKDRLFEESNEFILDLYDSGRSLKNLSLFKETPIIDKALDVYYIDPFTSDKNAIEIPISLPYIKKESNFGLNEIIKYYLDNFNKIGFIAKNDNQEKEIIGNLNFYNKEFEILHSVNEESKKDISLILSDFNFSYEDTFNKIALIDSSILFKKNYKNSPYFSKFKQGHILNNYQDLEVGDYVVHERYGIGQYLGIEQMTIGEKTSDYLSIQYNGNEKLLVPLYNFTLVRKYLGREGKKPNLSYLHSDKWNKTKKKIKEKINLLADKLLALYQSKKEIEGFQFSKDDERMKEFEDKFEHKLTNDQIYAIKDIKEDMEKPYPMDRLLCGDVGFGKTEVAFVAAFKAIESHKQVALICPTTLLAKQHYEIALSRFKGFDVNIKILTRNQTFSEENKIYEDIKNGKIDFLIGTHKLLNKKLEFKDLGLLIIDEEQRFGVEQKERIHLERPNIDVLTLSATPIPRTLQSSLIGLKSVSTISTPPKERLPIQTYVIEKDYKVIKEIIIKELRRNGQIYYIHNDIFSIYELGDKLKELVPFLKIGIIHGKLDKNSINDTMLQFYEGEIDLLLTTTIVENGIDVRNANLIIIDNANQFGLSQLYQIKGRVGRGDKMAYCYLLISKEKKITEDAKKRLKAIQDFTELGSGFKIAQRDLLIRGAGDILGPQQAGFIDEVGIDLYIKLLNETIKEKEEGIIKEESKKEGNLIINDAYVPKDFENGSGIIELYQKIKEADTFEKIDALKAYINDFYGYIPTNLNNLLIQRKIDVFLNNREIDEIKTFKERIEIILSKDFTSISGIGNILFEKLINYLKYIRITCLNRSLIIYIDKKEGYEQRLINILEIIHKEAIKNEIR